MRHLVREIIVSEDRLPWQDQNEDDDDDEEKEEEEVCHGVSLAAQQCS